MNNVRPYTLSIAGLDPSAGAGLLADIKTFEQNGVYGFGVITALTFQNDNEFISVEWIEPDNIIKQIEVLLKRFEIKYVKIGLIKDFMVLHQIVSFLHQNIKEPIIIFDPILKASAGYVFHNYTKGEVIEFLKSVYCITPNLPEMIELFGGIGFEKLNSTQLNSTNIYLKGGHCSDSEIIVDTLFIKGKKTEYCHNRLPNGAKHGSGCVLSSALIAQLALGHDIKSAAKNAHDYTHKFLASNDTLLGYHNLIT